MNKLYFGDNLDILRQLYDENPNGFIDLIYIDPPFNSKRNYNVLFESVDLDDANAQKEAFADTWSNVSYIDTLNLLSDLNMNLYNFLRNLDNSGISRSAISYLTTMAIRLFYLHKILKETGSFYLHCDSTMSHYLKILCDVIFGERNFRNEIIWQRTNSKGLAFTRFAQNHDVILYYVKSARFTWNPIYLPHNQDYIEGFYRFIEEGTGRKYTLDNLTNPNNDRPNLTYEFLGIKRVWRWTKDRMLKAYEDGLVVQTKPGTVPRLKRYLDEQEGNPLDDNWIDISANKLSKTERLGYPTQKPLALMERIITASSNEGDLVADFFCGCGTTIAAAEKLNRKWLGVDISHLAVRLIANRIGKENLNKTYEIHGFPRDIGSAKELANNVKGGRLEFEEWIVEYVLHGVLNERRNEMGYDGYRTFTIEKQRHIVMIEVKSGNVTMAQFNHFLKIVQEKGGSMGIFVCFEDQVTKNMQLAAKKEGHYLLNGAPWADKIQIATVEELLKCNYPKIPESTIETFKKAEKISKEKDTQMGLGF